MDWSTYRSSTWDELIADGAPRPELGPLADYLAALTVSDVRARQRAAEAAVQAMGITFTVYQDGANLDRAWPLDVLPRVITTQEWDRVEAGLLQRMRALNLFIDDLYGAQKVIADGVLPAELLADSANFRPECCGISPPQGVWAHISGCDLVRDGDGTIYVLEDNLRVPSGVSYMLENRKITKRVFGDLFRDLDIQPVDDYPARLYDLLASLTPRRGVEPALVVLTPGVHNSAYFEHAFLAQQMGAALAEGSDLVVDDDDVVWMRTIDGRKRVDVIYRRVDDLFLDPEAFRPDSMLGVPGLMRAWRSGTVAIANAPGAGVADDKVIYSYVPELVRYYLGEDILLPNVPTWRCIDPAERSHVLAHLHELVVKPANESGGYGILIGPRATPEELDEYRIRIEADPRNFIAQPTLAISTAPTLSGGQLAPRHLDLRPFVLSGDRAYVTRGGLTRVALREGSLVVNSSQGGGSKDTWIVDPTVGARP